MPKAATSIICKARQNVRLYPTQFIISPSNELYCQICETLVQCDKQSRVIQHIETSKHQRLLQKPSSSKQQFLNTQSSDFTTKVVNAFLSADIPLHKLRNGRLRQLFQDIGHPLPSESTCRSQVSVLADAESNRIKELMAGKQLFMVVDESDMNGTQYMNILVGNIESPQTTFVYDCIPLKSSPDSACVIRIIDDTIRSLETDRQNFCLLLSDAARYMTSAGKSLKVLYPQLFHITCLSHLVHNCALKVKTKYDNVDQLIARIKAATVKNRDRQAKFDEIGRPPCPVVTRWASWLNAAFYYADNFPTVKEIVLGFDDGGLLVARAKQVVQNTELVNDLVSISQCYRPLATFVVNIEGADWTIKQAYRDLVSFNLGDDPCQIKQYIAKRLNNNDIECILNATREDIPPTLYGLLQNCQPTSSSVERSFSMLRKLLAKDRQFIPSNVKKYLMLHYNNVSR